MIRFDQFVFLNHRHGRISFGAEKVLTKPIVANKTRTYKNVYISIFLEILLRLCHKQ